MTTYTLAQGTISAARITMSTLASGTYIASSAIDLGADIPIDKTFEVVATPNGTPTGNKQVVLFAKFSLDGTNYGSGPESGTTTTDEPDLHFIGTLPLPSASTVQRKHLSLAGLPVARYMKLVAKNDCGVALSSGYVYDASITGTGT